MRVVLYTGKGGVGKTSVAAATALTAAERGYKTMVMSTDAAHSLADSFDVTLGPEPTELRKNMWAHEIDVLRELDVHWRTVQDWLSALMRWQGADDIMAEELAILPGMEELAALLYIVKHHKDGFYDLVIVDCAPTGETLRLLSFPDMARWYMHRLFPLEKKVAAAVGPVARSVLRIPVPGAKVFDTVQRLYEQLEEMRSILVNPAISSVRLVVNPEKMVIKEARRTFTYLSLYGYHTDLIVCNRVLPDEVTGDYFAYWKEAQARYMTDIDHSFAPIPVLPVPFFDREVVGFSMLKEVGERLFGERDPTDMFYKGKVQEITKIGKNHYLTVRLPFVSKDALSVIESGDELIVQVGSYRRNILLPKLLVGLELEEARLDEDVLKIRFKVRVKTKS